MWTNMNQYSNLTIYLVPEHAKKDKVTLVLCQEKVQIKYALLMLSYPAKASALSSNAA